jgi:phosphoglycolate phosphatase-like HAD superfamily hydrolase
MNRLFLDLDGTLLDYSKRSYSLFCALNPNLNLSIQEFLSLRREGRDNYQILESFGWPKQQISNFDFEWHEAIESSEYLALDIVVPKAREWLSEMQKKYHLVLCTARQSASATILQLKEQGIYELVNKILVTEKKMTKSYLIESNYRQFSKQDWIIGDTRGDLETGQSLGISTCAVLTGLSNPNALREYSPDKIIATISDFR